MASSPPSAENVSPFSALIEQAIELAYRWVDGTYRKSRGREPAFVVPAGTVLRVPVMAHVTTVAMMVQRAGWDDVTVAAAFLHDILEDPNGYGRYMGYDELKGLMGKEVADRVQEVTEQKFDATGRHNPWRVRKERYLEGLSHHSPGAVAISLADKTHNLYSMNACLGRSIDIFTTSSDVKGLSAGPADQQWFHRSILDLSHRFDDPRLIPLRNQLEHEIIRFEEQLGLR